MNQIDPHRRARRQIRPAPWPGDHRKAQKQQGCGQTEGQGSAAPAQSPGGQRYGPGRQQQGQPAPGVDGAPVLISNVLASIILASIVLVSIILAGRILAPSVPHQPERQTEDHRRQDRQPLRQRDRAGRTLLPADCRQGQCGKHQHQRGKTGPARRPGVFDRAETRHRPDDQAGRKGKGQEPQMQGGAGRQHPPGELAGRILVGDQDFGQLEGAIDRRPDQPRSKQPLRPLARIGDKPLSRGAVEGQKQEQHHEEGQGGIAKRCPRRAAVEQHDADGRHQPGQIKRCIAGHGRAPRSRRSSENRAALFGLRFGFFAQVPRKPRGTFRPALGSSGQCLRLKSWCRVRNTALDLALPAPASRSRRL